ncbi:flagellar basal body rod protein FlgB [Helicobacter ailurogastricus]|nr:flagellar basal body rod protein FlgB [Helicobacter ailurogastricus]CRF40985.1 Flagellar basal-body rod protein FlgB [Helicobacter ailurogastricus]CRF42911.1 Flagellar basal-body rod protein FlgB [Helicobacter ailurogastricus]CRF44828.1 Flagellar basal-body rod protein FlgB [Helicobacter ailurogastricus]BDQ29148.1 flagellar basal body rod protein FlgB [Helicobacter ailurogastricus]GLH58510.1 Flagellar basal body rod protein FlgB [Helicobacter ailurogastricus]
MDLSKAYPLVYEAMDYRSLRQDLIASNVANVDTPFYRPKDVDFESVLAEKKAEVFDHKQDKVLELAVTDARHLEPNLDESKKATLFFRDGHLAKNDGNSVDLDIETSEMGKNSTMYLALTTALKKHRGIVNYAIEAAKNI